MADHGQGRGIGGHGHLDWGERPVPWVVWGAGAVPGALGREPRSVCELAVTVANLLGVEAPAAARGAPLVPALDPAVGPAPAGSARDRCLAIVVARDEETAVGGVLAGIPSESCGMPVDLLLIDDGSLDATPSIGRAAGARVLSHEPSRGLGAALRAGLELARDEGYGAAVYLDGDGEYTPADFERVLGPVARGRADYVLGSRFLGNRDGMSWHRMLANRATSALLGTLMDTVISDGQTGYRALSGRALGAARICHDYNYAQVLTLSLWGAGIEPDEVPIRYRRRTSGRSFVRYPEYFARVAPAIWREWRASRRTRRAIATAMPAASQYAQPPSGSNNGNSSTSGPNGASGRSVTSSPPARTST
jgi:Glycosyl transferase family 2